MANIDSFALYDPELLPFQQSFPVEIFLLIGNYLALQELSRVCRTSIDFASAFLPLLYQNVQIGSGQLLLSQKRADSLFCNRVSPSYAYLLRVADSS